MVRNTIIKKKGQLQHKLLLLVCVLLLPTTGLANDGMPSSIFDLIQEDQSVKVVLQIADPGDPGIGSTYKVERKNGEETTTLFSDRLFDPADAVYESEPSCRWMEPPVLMCEGYEDQCSDCDNNGYPDCFGECVPNAQTGESECQVSICESDAVNCNKDCNGDGTSDCWGYCRTVYRFEVTDHCVPEGKNEYELFHLFPDSEEWSNLNWDGPSSITMPVSNPVSNEECTAPEINNADDGTCSIARIGKQPHSLLQLLFAL